MRFLLIDRITALKSGESIQGIKNLSLAEEYLADHFPGFPVMPGVLMLECLVQAGAWLMRESSGFAYSTVLLKEAKAVRYNNFLKPGKTLTVSMTVKKKTDTLWDFQGSGTVDGESTVNARLSIVQFNLADRCADLKPSDELRIKTAREIFAQVWSPPVANTL